MKYGVSPPWYNDGAEVIGFNGYAMEIEERKEKIDKFINLLSKTEDPNDPQLQSMIFKSLHLDPFSLARSEILYIESEVSRLYE
jgi:hypothetical protein